MYPEGGPKGPAVKIFYNADEGKWHLRAEGPAAPEVSKSSAELYPPQGKWRQKEPSTCEKLTFWCRRRTDEEQDPVIEQLHRSLHSTVAEALRRCGLKVIGDAGIRDLDLIERTTMDLLLSSAPNLVLDVMTPARSWWASLHPTTWLFRQLITCEDKHGPLFKGALKFLQLEIQDTCRVKPKGRKPETPGPGPVETPNVRRSGRLGVGDQSQDGAHFLQLLPGQAPDTQGQPANNQATGIIVQDLH